MGQLPRKWSTGVGLLFLAGMAATAVLPYGLAVSVMDRYDARQMLEHTGVLLTLVIAIHVVACVVLSVLGFVAIKGRPVSAGFTLAIVCTPLMLGLILGRIEMGSAGAHALALSPEARPGEIAHALAFTAAPLLAGLFATVALLFAFCWSALLAHLALDRKAVWGSVGLFVAVSWVPAVAAVVGVIAFSIVTRQDPPHYSLPVWLSAVLLTFGVPFALPASKGLKGHPDRAAAEAAQRRLLIAVWTFPLAVALLAVAHALQILGEGLEQVQRGSGAAAVTQAEHEIAGSLPWVAVNLSLALITVAPLLLTGGTFRRLSGPRHWDRLALVTTAVLALGAIWFWQGRHALLGLTREEDELAARYQPLGLPEGEGDLPLGVGPTLRDDGSGQLKWDGGDGQLTALENARLDGVASLRVAVPAKTPFRLLQPALAAMAKGRALGFRLVERRPKSSPGREELSSLARAFEPKAAQLVALGFHFAARADAQTLAALAGPDAEAPHSAVLLEREGDAWSASELPLAGEPPGESWLLRADQPDGEGLRALRGRLDESPWVVVALGPDDTAQGLAELGGVLGRSNAIELVVTPR